MAEVYVRKKAVSEMTGLQVEMNNGADVPCMADGLPTINQDGQVAPNAIYATIAP